MSPSAILLYVGGRADGLLIAAEDRVLRSRRSIGDVVGDGRLGQGGLVLRHLCLVGRDVGFGRRNVRVDLRQVVLRRVVLLAQRGHLVLGLGQLRLDGGGLGLGVGDGVAAGRARQTKHSARQHCDNGQRGNADPPEHTGRSLETAAWSGVKPLYVSHDGPHSYRKHSSVQTPWVRNAMYGRTVGMKAQVAPHEARNSNFSWLNVRTKRARWELRSVHMGEMIEIREQRVDRRGLSGGLRGAGRVRESS